MTLEEFGAKIKTKYPQYADVSDTDLGQKMISKFPEYKEAVVCEIGSGAGQSLRQLSELGFGNLVGVESSKAQVMVASQGYGLNVLSGDFESSLVQK